MIVIIKLWLALEAKGTHLIPIQQEAVHYDPHDLLTLGLVFFLNLAELLLPSLDNRLLDRHGFLFVEVIVRYMFLWYNARFLDLLILVSSRGTEK